MNPRQTLGVISLVDDISVCVGVCLQTSVCLVCVCVPPPPSLIFVNVCVVPPHLPHFRIFQQIHPWLGYFETIPKIFRLRHINNPNCYVKLIISWQGSFKAIWWWGVWLIWKFFRCWTKPFLRNKMFFLIVEIF